jgi:hypothetical protein
MMIFQKPQTSNIKPQTTWQITTLFNQGLQQIKNLPISEGLYSLL